MLRRMDGLGIAGFGRMDWDGAAALGRRLLEWGALAGTMFLLCRATGASMPAPFAMAFLAAALTAGRNAAALLAGCAAGAVNGGLAGFNLRLPVGAAIVVGGGIAWDMLAPGLQSSLAEGWLKRLGDRLAGLRGRFALNPAPMRQAKLTGTRLRSGPFS